MNAISRHWDVVRDALAAEKAETRRLWDTEATAFLPAAIEIVEQPVSPTARWTARLLLLGLAVTILWLIFGRIDIVASAQGKIVPAGHVKLIQPAEAGIVRAILVRDGQEVRKGQVLVELDPTVSTAEAAQAAKALETAELDAARARAVLSALDGHGLVLRPPPGTIADVRATHLSMARERFAEISASASSRAADVSAARATRSEALIQAAKLTETLPLLDQQVDANETLLAKGFVSKLKVIEMRRQRLAAARDRDAAYETARRASAQIAGASAGGAQNGAEAKARILGELAKAEAEARLRREELAKARQRASLQRLVAPEDGTIAQLVVHTIGGVVEAAKPIMIVVPTSDALEVDARLLNKDVGFVAAGQSVAVKLDAFPFVRFGTIPGRVLRVGSDAIDDEKLGLVYPVRIRLERSSIDRRDRRAALEPGMAATVDIRTGRRSLLSMLMSPLDEARLSAGRER